MRDAGVNTEDGLRRYNYQAVTVLQTTDRCTASDHLQAVRNLYKQFPELLPTKS